MFALKKAWEIGEADITLVLQIDGDSPGAFGEVWCGHWDGIEVAVKVLRQSMLEMDDSVVAEFEREVEFMRHANIVRFFGAGTFSAHGTPFLVEELMSAGSLKLLLAGAASVPCEGDGQLTAAVKEATAVDICRGLGYIHALGHIHRDPKSGNVLVTAHLQAKVGDFGSIGLLLQRREPIPTSPAPGRWTNIVMDRLGLGRTGATYSDLSLTTAVGTPL